MITTKFKMTNIIDVKHLCELASATLGDVLLKKDSYMVDGSSLLGVLSIDMTSGAELIYPDDATELDKFIKSFSY